jgi:hypothetical protein
MNASLTKQPSAYLPMAMSLTAFALALSHVLFGVVHEADEGTAAHLWQLLMVGYQSLQERRSACWSYNSQRPSPHVPPSIGSSCDAVPCSCHDSTAGVC